MDGVGDGMGCGTGPSKPTFPNVSLLASVNIPPLWMSGL